MANFWKVDRSTVTSGNTENANAFDDADGNAVMAATIRNDSGSAGVARLAETAAKAEGSDYIALAAGESFTWDWQANGQIHVHAEGGDVTYEFIREFGGPNDR